MPTNPHLLIEIKNNEPVQLVDLTKSLLALSNEFQFFLKKTDRSPAGGEAVLYIQEIKTGSIIVQLQEFFTQSLLPFADNTAVMIEFALYIKDGIDFFLKNKQPQTPIELEEYKNFSAIVEPIAKDSAAQLNVSTVFNGNVEYHFHIDYRESNALQNLIKKQVKTLRSPVQDDDGIHKRQTLTFYQTRNDPKSTQGNKGKIESLNDRNLNVIFESDELMNEIIHGDKNPMETAYIVDVSIDTINGKPAIYRVIKLHESFDISTE